MARWTWLPRRTRRVGDSEEEEGLAIPAGGRIRACGMGLSDVLTKGLLLFYLTAPYPWWPGRAVIAVDIIRQTCLCHLWLETTMEWRAIGNRLFGNIAPPSRGLVANGGVATVAGKTLVCHPHTFPPVAAVLLRFAVVFRCFLLLSVACFPSLLSCRRRLSVSVPINTTAGCLLCAFGCPAFPLAIAFLSSSVATSMVG